MVFWTDGKAAPGGSARPRSAYHWVIMLGPSVVPDDEMPIGMNSIAMRAYPIAPTHRVTAALTTATANANSVPTPNRPHGAPMSAPMATSAIAVATAATIAA